MECLRSAQPVFRLWTVRAENWLAQHWHDVPPGAIALEPVEDALYSEDEAAIFVEIFNRAMLAEARPLWIVAVPVRYRLDGDAVAGQPVTGHVFDAEQPTNMGDRTTSRSTSAGGDPS